MQQILQHRPTHSAFTLAELLIALAILGVIATFTIPKILDSGSNAKFNSVAKEAISMVSGGYQAYKLNGSASASTSFTDFLPYLNYVRVDTTTQIDSSYNLTTVNCSHGSRDCILLHNGAILRYEATGGNETFGDTSSTSAIRILIDPDGKITSTGLAGTDGKSVRIYLYYNGRITNAGNILPNTYWGGGGPLTPDPSQDPPWFNWSN